MSFPNNLKKIYATQQAEKKSAYCVFFLPKMDVDTQMKCTSVSVLSARGKANDTLGSVERKMRINSAESAPKFLKKVAKKC